MNFSNILNINFTFVFQSCKCVRLLIMTRNERFREILYYFKFISDQELTGSGMIFSQMWILLKVSDRPDPDPQHCLYLLHEDHNLYLLS
jgi:hypothetical protein